MFIFCLEEVRFLEGRWAFNGFFPVFIQVITLAPISSFNKMFIIKALEM